MADRSGIEWTDATWNPVTGCAKLSPASPGCQNCYAATFAERWRGTPGHYFENGFDVQLRPDKLDQPLRWKRPRRIFVNSMSDLFHDSVSDEYIGSVFDVMARAEHHTFQVLTKRHARMRSLLRQWEGEGAAAVARGELHPSYGRAAWRRQDMLWVTPRRWPLPNVWLGVSAENQQWADIRIPALLDTPAAVRFVSAEPLLGSIDVDDYVRYGGCGDCDCDYGCQGRPPGIDWVIVGGESGPGARPMHPDWARSMRNQCQAAGVAFLFKQWGEWAPFGPDDLSGMRPDVYLDAATGKGVPWQRKRQPGIEHLVRIGKKAAGCELDGRTWGQYPDMLGVS